MLPATQQQASAQADKRRVPSWKGLDGDVLADAGVTTDALGRVFVPYRTRGGVVYNRKVFVPGGRCFWEQSGLGLIPFGLETLPPTARSWHRLLLCEGESDALAARSAYSASEEYVVVGVPGAHSWSCAWKPLFNGFPVIGVLGDGDKPGRELGWRVRRDLSNARPVRLPDGQDVRSLLQGQGRGALDALLREADETAILTWAFQHAATVDEFAAMYANAMNADPESAWCATALLLNGALR